MKRRKAVRWKLGELTFDRRYICLESPSGKHGMGVTEAQFLDFLVNNFGRGLDYSDDETIAYIWRHKLPDCPSSSELRQYKSSLYKSWQKLKEDFGSYESIYLRAKPYCLQVEPEPLLWVEEETSERVPILLSGGNIQISAVYDLAAELKMDPTKLMEEISKQLLEAGPVQLISDKQSDRKIRESNWQTDVLFDYYSDKDLSQYDLRRYGASIDGTTVRTNIAVREAEIGMQLDLKEHDDWFALKKPEFQVPSISDKYEEVSKFVVETALLGIRATNDPVFCLQNLSFNDRSNPATFSLAHYFEYRLTHGRLGKELNDALRMFSPRQVLDQREHLLKRRERLLPDVASLTKFSHRFCVGGVNVLFAVRRPGNDFVFFVEERSEKVASARGEESLIPSAFHQPLTRMHAANEVSITKSIFREILEEVFNGEQVISHDGHIASDWYFKFPHIEWFKEHPRDFIFKLVCFGLDLIDGSYQWGALLAVTNPEYWLAYGDDICTNWEYKHRDSARMISTQKPDEIAAVLQNPLCAHTSVFTIIEALRVLEELKPTNVKLPPIQ